MIDTEVTLKSTLFLAIRDYLCQRMPQSSFDALVAGLSTEFPDDVRRLADGRILASDRFSVRFGTAVIERAAAALHEPAAAIAHAIGRRGAEAATGGVLRFVFALMSMGSFLTKIQPVWSQMYSHGRTSYEMSGKSATVELHDFPFVSATNCARITGSLEWFAQKAERSAVLRHISCRSNGEPACRWGVTW